MQKDQSGFHTGVQISYNTFENYYAVLPGYTFNGKLTLGIDIGKTKDLVNKINSTVIRPNASYLLVRQSEEGSPLSFDLNIGYQYNYVSQVIFNARSVQFGAGLYHEIKALEDVKLIPSVFFDGNKATSGPNPRFQETAVFAYGGQVSLVWNNYYLTPKIYIQEGITTITAKLGIIFPKSKTEDEINN